MELAAAYESSEGKFPAAYGNVALVDCHFIDIYLYDFAENVLKPTLNPIERIGFQIFLNNLI